MWGWNRSGCGDPARTAWLGLALLLVLTGCPGDQEVSLSVDGSQVLSSGGRLYVGVFREDPLGRFETARVRAVEETETGQKVRRLGAELDSLDQFVEELQAREGGGLERSRRAFQAYLREMLDRYSGTRLEPYLRPQFEQSGQMGFQEMERSMESNRSWNTASNDSLSFRLWEEWQRVQRDVTEAASRRSKRLRRALLQQKATRDGLAANRKILEEVVWDRLAEDLNALTLVARSVSGESKVSLSVPETHFWLLAMAVRRFNPPIAWREEIEAKPDGQVSVQLTEESACPECKLDQVSRLLRRAQEAVAEE